MHIEFFNKIPHIRSRREGAILLKNAALPQEFQENTGRK
jgi:hypothetical protein